MRYLFDWEDAEHLAGAASRVVEIAINVFGFLEHKKQAEKAEEETSDVNEALVNHEERIKRLERAKKPRAKR